MARRVLIGFWSVLLAAHAATAAIEVTTLTGASAAVMAIKALRSQALTVRSLQDYYAGVEAGA